MRKKSKYGKNQRNFQKTVKIKNQEGQTRTTNFISLISQVEKQKVTFKT